MTQTGTCSKHEDFAIKLNTAEQEIKAMKECINTIKNDNIIQNSKIDKISDQLTTLPWKLIGGVGALVLLSNLIINFVK